jgi:hypothetical protein
MSGNFLSFMIALGVLGVAFFIAGFVENQHRFSLPGTASLCIVALLVGGYLETGKPLSVQKPGSYAKFVVGHLYENLGKVPVLDALSQNDSDTFVIKDGGSDKILLIRTKQQNLPQRFTVNDKGVIVALPAELPASAASAPVSK